MRFVLLICVAVLFCNFYIASASGCSAPECINNGNTEHSTVILCNSCLLKSGSYSRVLRHKLKSIGIKSDEQTQITDLNFDELILIFEHLDTEDILNFGKAESDPTILDAVKHTFWNRYKNYTVHVGDFSEDISFTNETILISNQKGLKVLKIFGSGIRSLKMNSTTAFVSEFVNKYVGDFLIKLELEDISKDTFINFKHPFENVEELIFDYSQYNGSRAGQPSLNQQFPALRNLTLNIEQDIDPNFSFSSFRHLKILKLNDDRLTENQIELILSQNPQIQNLKVFKLSQNMTNIINSHLLSLENLTVSTFDIKVLTKFEHLKHLVVLESRAGTVNKISCPQLSSLQMRFARNLDLTQPWTQFLAKHQTLSHLTILGTSKNVDVNPGLVLLTMFSGSLVEIIIDGTSAITVDTFVKIFENNPELERLVILRGNITRATEQIFRETFGKDWNIIESKDLILERKH